MHKIDSIRLFEGITYIDQELIEAAQGPAQKRRGNIIWLRKAGALAASFMFAAAVLLFVNAAFPAFAESLPVIGQVFRQLNSLGSNAPSYEGMVQSIGESGENSQYIATVTEAYCDGEYIFFAMRLQPKDSKLLKMETLYTEESAGEEGAPGWDVTINGESAGLGYSLPVFTRNGAYFESVPVQVRLPEGTDQSAPVHVEAAIGNLCGRAGETVAGQVISMEPVSLGFDLEANTGHNRQTSVQGVEVDGLKLLSWSLSPSKFGVDISYPYFDMTGVSARARTSSGQDLGGDLREYGDFGDGRYAPGDTAIQKCSFTGPPDGTEKVIITVYSEHTGGTAVFGEFTIDLETGDAAVTENYLDGGFEHIPIDEYAAGIVK